MKRKYLLLLIIFIGCRKELDISEFSFNFSNYTPELRLEALILPHDSTAIVRIDKSYLINMIIFINVLKTSFEILNNILII